MNTPAAARRFSVPPPGKGSIMFMCLAPLIPGLAMLFAVARGADVPAGAALVAGAALAIVFGLLWSVLRRCSVTFDGDVLVVRAGFYTRRVAITSLNMAAARVLSLDEHREDRPFWRTNGIGLPGYRAGHYRTRSRQRAFCLLTDFSRVLRLEESDGHLLLLSLERPRELLQALQSANDHQPR